MDPAQFVHPTLGGLACALGAVVSGAALFRAGLRALRLRRHRAGLAEKPLTGGLEGFVHVSGTVTLDSPMFTPLSAAPCAAFQLEIQAVGAPIVKTVEERRPFRVVGPGATARLESTAGRWPLPATAAREVAPDEPLPERLSRLLGRVPEAVWWRRAGGRLRLVERSLLPGSSCHVAGFARSRHALDRLEVVELEATGTDGAFEVAVADTRAEECELSLGPGDLVDFLFVSDRAPEARDLAAPAWRTLGAFAGPALSLLGLLYLAAAADALRALGRL